MPKVSKKLLEVRKMIDLDKFYSLEEAISLSKKTAFAKFDSTIDLVLNLNLDVRQAEQQLRGSIALPHGTGKSVIILVATDNKDQAAESKKNGAEIIADSQELKEILDKGKLDFDIIIADPKMMPILGRYGKLLGPKGLMPNPKTGTVTPEVSKAVSEVKKGKANYRTDKNGIVHTIIGKKSMDDDKLLKNAETILETIKKIKPSAVKGAYIKNFVISSTMGPSIKVKIEK